jgi:hypothetical protein
VTTQENVHIKGDLCVGTYKDETGTEKNFEDSCEHACVWQPKRGADDTTGAGFMTDADKSAGFNNNAKPAMGGGVFSFRAGHVDLHPIFISRKQPKQTSGTKNPNTVRHGEYRSWNPTSHDEFHFQSFHDYANGGSSDYHHSIKALKNVSAGGDLTVGSNLTVKNDTYLEQALRLPGIQSHGEQRNGPKRPAGASTVGWVYENSGDDALKTSK